MKEILFTILFLLRVFQINAQAQEISLGFDKSGSISSNQWEYYFINIIGDERIVGSLLSIYVVQNGEPYRLLYIYTKQGEIPNFKNYDERTLDQEPRKEYASNVRISSTGRFYIGIFASPCNAPLPCNTTWETFTTTFQIGASTSNSIPFWPTLLIGGSAFLAVFVVFFIIIYFIWKKKRNYAPSIMGPSDDDSSSEEDTQSKFLKSLSIKVNVFLLGEVTVEEPIGSGAFSEVFKGDWRGTPVALKRLRMEENLDDLLMEIQVLSSLNHLNVVRLLGLYTSENDVTYIVTEFVEEGSLQKLLQSSPPLEITSVLRIAKQIVIGMMYLVKNNIIHRDLALRNILAEVKDDSYFVKLSDFGLSRELKDSYYYSSHDKRFPVKWSAPEILKWRKYSTKSDVWAFGVVLWELLESGREPYGDMSNSEANSAVLQGYRLPQPPHCPNSLYDIMRSCWQTESQSRPTFEEIYDQLDVILVELSPKLVQEESESSEDSEGEEDIIPPDDHYAWGKTQTSLRMATFNQKKSNLSN